MAKSIIQSDKTHCFLCEKNGSSDRLEEHHIFGAANRNNSEKYGLTVHICGNECHRLGVKAVHRNAQVAKKLKRIAQEKAMEYYGWTKEDFIKIFGMSFID